MIKNQKILSVIGVLGLGYVAYILYKNKKNKPLTALTQTTSQCPIGEVICPNGITCYNPTINYLVSPCSSIS
jgi:uncharacterized membrane protein YebE (DUF533 family)